MTFGTSPSSAQDTPPLSTQGVQLRSLTKRYGTLMAVENLTLEIPAGSYCCLLGPSGCGKTTTLQLLAGHETATAGDIYIGPERVTHLPPQARNTAMVFQDYALFPHKTVAENVGFGLKMRGMKQRDRTPIVQEMLELVEMSGLGDRRPHQLSGGQQQRIALARALATRPQVLLLDEPLSALDESLRVKTRGELRRLQQQFGLTFIQVTHAQDEAFALADQIVVMAQGRLDQVGTPSEIYHAPASQFVAEFVGDHNLFVGQVTAMQAGESCGESAAETTLSVEGLGELRAQGQGSHIGQNAAACVRSDRLQLAPIEVIEADATLPNRWPAQRWTAKIAAIEFTGYITRVTLKLTANAQAILYKTPTDHWRSLGFAIGQAVQVGWSIPDCRFLPH
ncbi:MAG: ABC transporter ATP-binding protein [Cyanobacteria bacterium P01_G01_bin.54]